MSKKRTKYTSVFKTKLVLEVLQINQSKNTKNTVISYEDLISVILIMYGVLTLPISRLQVVWFIWLPLLIGTVKLCYRTKYLTQWIHS